MAKRTQAADDYDSPWKIALHFYLSWFLAFFYPRIHADIDWSRGYESLDKEFQQVVREAEVGRLSDHLAGCIPEYTFGASVPGDYSAVQGLLDDDLFRILQQEG